MAVTVGTMLAVQGLTTLASGIFGGFQANNANNQAKKNYKKQMEAAEEQADKINDYNKKKFENTKANWRQNEAYQWETALQEYEYTLEIQKYREAQEMRAYKSDQARVRGQKAANAYAAAMGVESEQRALEQVRIGNAFEQQDAMVQQLRAAGKAALGQAGKSTQRTINDTIAQLGRDIAVRDASLNSAITDTAINLMSIKGDAYFADRNLDLTAMLKPEELPEIPEPIRPPEPIWLEPMEVDPMFITPPTEQSVAAPIISGALDAATGFISGGIKAKMFGGQG
tara:strand:+ start:3176 stop:4027 length:852 start_codon:yes stop_codon:yes gene_type:complete